MNTLGHDRLLSSDDLTIEVSSIEMVEEETSDIESKKDCESSVTNSYKRSTSSTGSYVVDYGPIRVRHRRNPSRTFATGRRSKEEVVSDDEAIKREQRREKNRIAARELNKKRDKVELNLIQTLEDLEQEKNFLQDQHKKLQEHKAQLNRALYNAKQTPLIPLIVDMNIPLFFEPQQRHDLLVDLQPLLKIIDEQFCSFD